MGTRSGIFAVDQGNGTPRHDTGIIESPDAVNRLIKRIGEPPTYHDTRTIQAWMGPQQYPAYRALHGVGAGSVQGLLAALVDW